MTSANPRRQLEATWALLEEWNAAGHCRAIAAETGSHDESFSFATGQLTADDLTPVTDSSIFLIASPTKPFVATAAMMLVEQGRLQLDHRVVDYVPQFRGGGKRRVRILHLLTHTSGLPDMLPNNTELRVARAPLSEFLEHVFDVDLVAQPGTRVHYQSMGILVLAAIIEQITSLPLAEFLSQQVFQPLGMGDTALGAPQAWASSGHWGRMTHCQVDDQPHATDWGWNSHYWRELGAPWGGLLSTAGDLGRFCRHLLLIHRGGEGILAPQTLRVMTTNQLGGLHELPEQSIRCTPWGLGWQLNWPGHSRGFGSLLPAESYGHWGATGTMVWIDPTRSSYGVVLTTEPIGLERRRQIAFGNLSSLVWPASSEQRR